MGSDIDTLVKKLLNESAEVEFEYMWKDMVVARVWADVKNKTVRQEVYGDNRYDTPITNPVKDIHSLMDFFESRCFPRTRFNCEQLLGDLGLTHYNPYDICRKTRGLQWDDYYWVRFKGDTADYEDIKLRD